jgi:hypothetical protein
MTEREQLDGETGAPAEWFYCLDHHRVERRGRQCPATVLLGPFATEAEAARALESAREATEAWDEEDERWD